MKRRIAFLLAGAAALLAATATQAEPRLTPGVNAPNFGAQSVWPVNANLVGQLDRMAEMNIRWARFDLIWWSLAEREPGVYNFTSPNFPGYQGWNVDRMMELLAERGIEPFPILCYSSPLYDNETGPFSEEGRTAFANYCFAAADRYKDSVDYWEVWNEPNLQQFWGRAPHPQDYALLVAAAAPRIREANPNAVIAGGATSGIDMTFLAAAFQHGLLDHIDILTVHPYRLERPESINGEIAALRALMAQHTTRDIPIWTGEWGYNTCWTGISPTAQAKVLTRMVVNNMAQGIDLSIWFSTHAFREETNCETSNAQWGLIDFDLSPRPSYFAMQALNELLPPPLEHVPNPYTITLEPARSNTRIEALRHGDTGRHSIALWRATWPPTADTTGQQTVLTLTAPEGLTLTVRDPLTGDTVPTNLETPTPGTYRISNFPLRDYPLLLQVEPRQGGADVEGLGVF